METETKAVALLKKELPQLKAIIALNVTPGTDVQTMALEEIEHLKYHALTKPEILECEPITVAMAVRSCLKLNLSLDPNQGLVYVTTRNIAVMEGGQKVWKKALEIKETCNGKISVARQCGRILDVDRPEIRYNSAGKVVSATSRFLIPTFDEKGNPATRWKELVFDESDIRRSQLASHKDRGRNKNDANNETMNYANALYRSHNGGIDPEFARAKAINHGLKKLGVNIKERKVMAPIVKPMTYNVDPTMATADTEEEITPHEVVEEGTTKVHVETHEVITIPNTSEL